MFITITQWIMTIANSISLMYHRDSLCNNCHPYTSVNQNGITCKITINCGLKSFDITRHY